MLSRVIDKKLATLLNQVEELSHQSETPADRKGHVNFYMLLRSIESKISFDMIIDLLKVTLENKEITNAEILDKFRHFFETRWKIIHLTDSEYVISPSSSINKACLLVANLLAPLEGKHSYEWLMPTIDFHKAVTLNERSIFDYKLHELLIGIDEELLTLDACFDFFEARAEAAIPAPRRKINCKSSQANSNKKLRPALKSLDMINEANISKHSMLAENYYNAILLKEPRQDLRQAFYEGLAKGDFKITATHCESGQEMLKQSLMANVDTLIGLTNFLFMFVPKKYWQQFLNNLPHAHLFKIVVGLELSDIRKESGYDHFGRCLDGKTYVILKKLSEGTFKFEHEDHLRALMLCLFKVYHISREEGPPFRSALGYLGSFLSMSYSKKERIESCEVMMNFLMVDPPHPLADLTGYLKAKEFNEQIVPLTQRDDNSTLYKLTKLMLTEAAKISSSQQVSVPSYRATMSPP